MKIAFAGASGTAILDAKFQRRFWSKVNIRDCVKKGRNSPPPICYGLANNKAKFSAEDLVFIRESKLDGAAIARLLGVNRCSVNRVRSGRTRRCG